MGNESTLSPSQGICRIRCQGDGVRHQLPLPVFITGPESEPDIPPREMLHNLMKAGRWREGEIPKPI